MINEEKALDVFSDGSKEINKDKQSRLELRQRKANLL